VSVSQGGARAGLGPGTDIETADRNGVVRSNAVQTGVEGKSRSSASLARQSTQSSTD
jgi:hypothetical protein